MDQVSSVGTRITALIRGAGEDGQTLTALVEALAEVAPPDEVRRELRRLAREGTVVRGEAGSWHAALASDVELQGLFFVRQGLFYVDADGSAIEVPHDQVGDAVAGDRVAFRITYDNGRGLRAAAVNSVVQPVPRKVDGKLTRYEGHWIVTAAGIREPMVLLPERNRPLKPGDLLQVEVRGRVPIPRTAGFLPRMALAVGPVADQPRFSVDPRFVFPRIDPHERNATALLDGLARTMGLDQPFSEDALNEVVSARPPDGPGPGDWDLRNVPLVTIDGETAKDFDDAVYAHWIGDDIRLLVAVADVSAYVVEEGALDRDARYRGCSVYLPGRVYPMLPSRLSDDLCSLRPHENRRCAWVSLLIRPNGRVEDVEVGFGVMRSAERLTYTRVQQYFDGADDHFAPGVAESLLTLDKARVRLNAHRIERGMLDLDRPEPVVALSGDGARVENILPHPRYTSHRLIEECMVAANEAVARWLAERHWPAPTRVHGDPDPAKVSHVRDVARGLGMHIPLGRKPTVEELARVLDSLQGTPMAQIMSYLILRSVPRAEYAVEGRGHFGIGAEHYLHFTSPIRRYPDLMVHRLLRHALEHEKPPQGARLNKLKASLQVGVDASNKGEERSKKAERFAERMLRARMMVDRVGEEFDAVISDMAPFGLFITVSQPYLEGTVPIRRLGREYIDYDDVRQQMHGSQSGTVWKLGDRLRVKCAGVDLQESRVLFDIVAHVADAGASPRRPDRRGVAGAMADLPKVREAPDPDRVIDGWESTRSVRTRPGRSAAGPGRTDDRSGGHRPKSKGDGGGKGPKAGARDASARKKGKRRRGV